MDYEFKPNPPSHHRRYLIFLLALVVIGLVLLFWMYSQNRATVPVDTADQAEQSEVEIVETRHFSEEELPPKLPTGFPVEQGQKEVVNNYEVRFNNGSTQSTRKYISTFSVRENFELYDDFLKESDWSVETSQQINENLYYIFARKGAGELSVNINQNTVSGEVTVDLSYVTR